MRSKIWRSMALTAVLAVVLFAILSMAALYSFFTARTQSALDGEARLIATYQFLKFSHGRTSIKPGSRHPHRLRNRTRRLPYHPGVHRHG